MAGVRDLIPLPSSLKEVQDSAYKITPATTLSATGEAAEEAEMLAARLRSSTGFSLPVKTGGKGIAFLIDPSLQERLGEEGYLLESGGSGVKITAAGRAGLFYGGRTLLQLIPADALSAKPVPAKEWVVPAVAIEDRPRFAWRGFMLDDARQFFGMDHVKRTLDAMALHKLNRLHWHLTDDEGWRIEIKAYPKLTSVGAWRGSECAVPNPRNEKRTRYGGFYTQAELREVVAYAKARHIEIMPEVDIPGHSLATVTAYPELLPEGKGGGISAQGFTANALSPAKEETYKFVEAVFDELAGIFPFEYIHIGGDEVNHEAWKDCPQIAALMQREKLSDLGEAQLYFTRRLEKIFAARKKRIFGWNEILDDSLDRSTGIMSWTGVEPGYRAAKMGFPVVMAASPFFYLDMGYPGAEGEPPGQKWAGLIDDARVYSFDPLGAGGDLPQAAKDRILGVQGQLWAEFIEPWKGDALDLPTFSAHADYKTWPRLAALAEVGWTPQDRRNYGDFHKRLGSEEFRRLETLGIYFRIPVPTATHRSGKLTIRPPFPGADVRYTLDGSLPTASSTAADGPINLAGRDPAKLKARTFFDGRGSTVLAGSEAETAARWTSNQLAAAQGPLEFDVSSDLTSAGVWSATCRYTAGLHAVEISDAEILINGVSVARDDHQGRAGSQHRDNVWRFDVPSIPPGAKVTLRAKFTGDGGKDSNGTITLEKSAGE